MFVSLHQHLPGPMDDVERSAWCSNSILGTRQMSMHEKNMCDPYILAFKQSDGLFNCSNMLVIKHV